MALGIRRETLGSYQISKPGLKSGYGSKQKVVIKSMKRKTEKARKSYPIYKL